MVSCNDDSDMMTASDVKNLLDSFKDRMTWSTTTTNEPDITTTEDIDIDTTSSNPDILIEGFTGDYTLNTNSNNDLINKELNDKNDEMASTINDMNNDLDMKTKAANILINNIISEASNKINNITPEPTLFPTIEPTNMPSSLTTSNPTILPTWAPTNAPTLLPTVSPSNTPTISPTKRPTLPDITVPDEIELIWSINNGNLGDILLKQGGIARFVMGDDLEHSVTTDDNRIEGCDILVGVGEVCEIIFNESNLDGFLFYDAFNPDIIKVNIIVV